ncbi:MAG: hypothetical protein E7441_11185 [Ruminococcaceae bacterium]|nr:hypothetical protein [Oscillospiraceae bacterium]
MKIAIMTDMEGVAGILNFEDWVLPGGTYYEEGKKLLTEEVNAAICGFCDAGADEIVVIDGHGHGGVNPILLDPRALYSRGWAVYHQFGLNDNFDAVAWIGQHAKAGTVRSHMTHTMSLDIIDSRINGVSYGEFGRIAMISGMYGTRAIFGSGERAFVEEAKALLPHIHAVEVKYGVNTDNGVNCTTEEYRKYNLGAVHVHPSVARERIYAGAKAALTDFIKNPEKFKVFCPEPPYVLETWFRKKGNAPAYKEIRRHDTDLMALFSAPQEIIPEGKYEKPY